MIKKNPQWTKSTPGQYGSNGINSDGSLMNVGNKLGKKPSIRIFKDKHNSRNIESIMYKTNEQEELIWPEKLIDIQSKLWNAADKGDTELVKECIKFGANPLEGNPSNFNWTALHYAINKNRFVTTKYLLSLDSALLQLKNKSSLGKTPEALVNNILIENLIKKFS